MSFPLRYSFLAIASRSTTRLMVQALLVRFGGAARWHGNLPRVMRRGHPPGQGDIYLAETRLGRWIQRPGAFRDCCWLALVTPLAARRPGVILGMPVASQASAGCEPGQPQRPQVGRAVGAAGGEPHEPIT
jgi:hypothetical protein